MARRLAPARSVAMSVAALASAAAMVATPLAGGGGVVRRRLAGVVVGGLAVTASTAAARRWGSQRTALAAGAVIGATVAVERIGTSTGLPFGRYRYTGVLRPTVGGVPIIVPIAWWAMALPAREAAVGALRLLDRRPGRAARIGLAAMALTAWDLFLDPQMVAEGFWRWDRHGAYAGIPVSNYLGWLATSTGVMAALDVALPPGRPDARLVAQYALMGSMETVGFAAFFCDRLVALVGGAAMMPIAAAAMAGTWRR